MKRFFVFLITVAFLGLVVNGTALSTEYIVNGGFETGDFTGWVVDSQGLGTWVINDGTIVPTGPLGNVPPISGNYDAMTIQEEEHYSLLYQQLVTLPTNISSATLSWSDLIFNFCEDGFIPEAQYFRVWIFDGTEEHTIFLTQPGDPTIQEGPNNRSFDVTSLLQSNEGQEIYVAFEVMTLCFFNNIMVDDISLDIDTVLPVTIDIKPGSYPNSINLGSNGKVPVAIFGSADFDVTTVNFYSITLASAEVVLKGKAQTPMVTIEDVNEDGVNDLIIHIDTEALELSAEDTIAILEGETDDGTPIIGEDTIRIAPITEEPGSVCPCMDHFNEFINNYVTSDYYCWDYTPDSSVNIVAITKNSPIVDGPGGSYAIANTIALSCKIQYNNGMTSGATYGLTPGEVQACIDILNEAVITKGLTTPCTNANPYGE